ncbi:hypothetical protein N865_06255 [Intrasporangium oryzae NRRL B-24470]|uniref:YdbS-like PH domain-containing protein n=1 Tax=Intrasporangium oryzae NRRL B-24470 TaxID=1386089 RepID=W9GAW4_9MICO|nr:PH domain-containing protein [Intrasporangium oryzae]EWT02372.1 hypothetical protein N865_06255 [Intrasporangium oryzae NRRL B-24470]
MTERAPGDGSGWRRLDARMLLVHPVQTFVRFLPAILAILIARSSTSGSSDGDRWELVALPLIVAVGALRWLTTRYRIGDGQIELRRGLLNKTTTTARLDRVRTVDLTSELHHRALGLAKVEISTGSAGKDRLVLDSLSLVDGRRLRAELLHRAAPAPAPDLAAHPVLPVAPADVSADEELLRLDPAWVRYAPLTLTGLATAAAVVGFAVQGLQRYADDGALTSAAEQVRALVWWADVVILLAVISLLAVLAYVLSFWGFRLSRNTLGTLHARRGLLTTRETTIDRSRLRGVRVEAPLGLRLAGARRLRAVSTGLPTERGGGSDWLSPPAPVEAVTTVAVEIVDDASAVLAALVPHGPAARRRRLNRALAPAVVVGAALIAARAVLGWPTGFAVAVPVLLAAAFALGMDRYAGLGHLVTPTHLVAQHGSLDRSRVVLAREGIIGWTIRQSFFQRRAGVVTLVATTAAGRQHYELVDVTPERAHAVVAEITPALVADFS